MTLLKIKRPDYGPVCNAIMDWLIEHPEGYAGELHRAEPDYVILKFNCTKDAIMFIMSYAVPERWQQLTKPPTEFSISKER